MDTSASAPTSRNAFSRDPGPLVRFPALLGGTSRQDLDLLRPPGFPHCPQQGRDGGREIKLHQNAGSRARSIATVVPHRVPSAGTADEPHPGSSHATLIAGSHSSSVTTSSPAPASRNALSSAKTAKPRSGQRARQGSGRPRQRQIPRPQLYPVFWPRERSLPGRPSRHISMHDGR